jgi:hypothetical protein
MHFEGMLIKKLYAKSSKSEREAIFLKLENGKELLLLRVGGNRYQDEELLALVEKKVAIEGTLEEDNLYFTTLEVL